MTAEPRPVRDILAECMRRERNGLMRPLWSDWWEEGREPVRRRADHLIRLLNEFGVELVQTGAPLPTSRPESPVVWRSKLHGREAERLVRRDAAGWSIITVEHGAETIEQTFHLESASINGGAVLTDDPAARQIPGLGRQLAAALEIFRVDVAGMEPRT
jgi:hypothetical protein